MVVLRRQRFRSFPCQCKFPAEMLLCMVGLFPPSKSLNDYAVAKEDLLPVYLRISRF